MQRWNDELIKHPLNVTVKQILDSIDRDLDIEDPVAEAERIRFVKVIRLLESTISLLDAEIAPFDVLDQLNSSFVNQGIPQFVQGVSSSTSAEMFRSLNTRLSPILSYIGQLRANTKGIDVEREGIKSSTDAFEKFSRTLDKRKKDFEGVVANAEARLVAATNDIEQVSATLKIESVEHRTSILKLNEDSTALVAQQRQDFSELNAANSKQFSLLTESIKQEVTSEFSKFFEAENNSATKRRDELQQQSEATMESVNELHQKIKKLYGLVATDSVVGGHIQIAEREQKAAQNWRYATVGSIVVAMTWIIYTIFCLQPALEPIQVFWLQIGKSISLTALLISLAVYSSKQAALHRMNERRYRSFSLQVEAFDPFIESLNESDKQELKKALSTRIFGPDEVKSDDAVLDQPMSIVKEIVGLVVRLKSK